MDSILQSLQELEGVNGAVVTDGAGRLLGFRAHSVYDADLLQRVGKFVASAVDSVKLVQEDWSAVNAQFAEGKLLIRNLSEGTKATERSAILLVIADARLNVSFAGVAIRVAVSKLRALLEANPAAFAAGGTAVALGAGVAQHQQTYAAVSAAASGFGGSGGGAAGRSNASEVASSGLSWSGLGGSSTLTGSGVFVADAASSEFLTLCTKALAKCVGPMAKLYVKEAARKVSPDRPFSRDNAEGLIAELMQHISDPTEAANFRAHALKR